MVSDLPYLRLGLSTRLTNHISGSWGLAVLFDVSQSTPFTMGEIDSGSVQQWQWRGQALQSAIYYLRPKMVKAVLASFELTTAHTRGKVVWTQVTGKLMSTCAVSVLSNIVVLVKHTMACCKNSCLCVFLLPVYIIWYYCTFGEAYCLPEKQL